MGLKTVDAIATQAARQFQWNYSDSEEAAILQDFVISSYQYFLNMLDTPFSHAVLSKGVTGATFRITADEFVDVYGVKFRHIKSSTLTLEKIVPQMEQKDVRYSRNNLNYYGLHEDQKVTLNSDTDVINYMHNSLVGWYHEELSTTVDQTTNIRIERQIGSVNTGAITGSLDFVLYGAIAYDDITASTVLRLPSGLADMLLIGVESKVHQFFGRTETSRKMWEEFERVIATSSSKFANMYPGKQRMRHGTLGGPAKEE